MKSKRGGARVGAGRKPVPPGEKTAPKIVYLLRPQWEEIAKKKGVLSWGKFFWALYKKSPP